MSEKENNKKIKKEAGDYTKIETKERILTKILEWQETSAPITIQIGYTDETNFVHSQEILLKKCPPSIIENLRNDEILKGYIQFSVCEDGVHLELF